MHNIIITIFNSQFWSINCKFPGSINIDIRRHLYSTILDSNKSSIYQRKIHDLLQTNK